MEQMRHYPQAPRRIGIGRIAAAIFAVMGFISLIGIPTAGATTSHVTKGIVISTVKNKKLGTILVAGGKTVYSLKPSKAGCTADCTTFWFPVELPKGVRKARPGKRVSASKLGTVSRDGGVPQVTYGGKALYWFSGDTTAGKVTDNGVRTHLEHGPSLSS